MSTMSHIFCDLDNEKLKQQILDALKPIFDEQPPTRLSPKARGEVIDIEYEEVDDGA